MRLNRVLRVSMVLMVTGAVCAAVRAIEPHEPKPAPTPAAPASAAEQTLRAIYTEALLHGRAYDNLKALVANHPGRLAGSPALENAIGWAGETLTAMKVDRVATQEVMVPHWERGEAESVFLLDPSGMSVLSACALGGSGAAAKDGVFATVVEVRSLEELAALGEAKVRGHIVFFNRPMDETLVRPGDAYAGAADQRVLGPAAAARLGAFAALVRSMTERHDDVPHTGVTRFPPDVPRIPALALSWHAAERLSAAVAEAKRNGTALRVGLKVNAQFFPDVPSHNVMGELRGSEFPDQVLVVGGHLDSWDLAPGAHDDGAGVVQSIEVLRIFQALGIKPRHTIRCVLFVNEEISGTGAKAYAERARTSGEKHLLALESDSGGFEPRAISLKLPPAGAAAVLARWQPLLRPYGIELQNGGGGSDVTPLGELGIAVGQLRTDSQRYFDLHHSREDTIEQVNPRELHLGAAALAAVIWLADTQGW